MLYPFFLSIKFDVFKFMKRKYLVAIYSYLFFCLLEPSEADDKYFWQAARYYIHNVEEMNKACDDMRSENEYGVSAFVDFYMPSLPDRFWSAIGKRQTYWYEENDGSYLLTGDAVRDLKRLIARKNCPDIY